MSHAGSTSEKDEEARDLFDAMRGTILHLGPSVVEDVRVHRSVYGKGSILRPFAELFILSDRVRLAVYTGNGISDPAKALVERGPRWSYMDIRGSTEIDYAVKMVSQSFEKV